VKYKYCPECKKAYLKSRLEKEKCIYCGKPCEIVDIKRSGRYYMGYGIMVLGAVVMFVVRFWFSDINYLWIWGIVFVVLGAILVMDASNKMAARAAETVRKKDKEEN